MKTARCNYCSSTAIYKADFTGYTMKYPRGFGCKAWSCDNPLHIKSLEISMSVRYDAKITKIK